MRPWLVLLLAIPLLTAAALGRSAEYDEQYSLFLTGQQARPIWPDLPFPADLVRNLQAPAASPADIATALRRTDVHPPLYFWLLSGWRDLTGDSLTAARLFSVLCAVATLALVGRMAVRAAAPPALAMALTLGCYGFVYTGVIARGFALAQLLAVGGAVLLFRATRPASAVIAGLCLGAATAANYLAIFPIAGILLGWTLAGRWRAALAATLGILPWILLDLWFFTAQRGARPEQFPPFQLLPSLGRLGRYAAANVVGGLPLYVSPRWEMPVVLALGLLVASAAALTAWHVWRGPLSSVTAALACASVAPAIGLLLLGLAFDNTPIELRYLAFTLPFAMPLLAAALAAPPRETPSVDMSAAGRPVWSSAAPRRAATCTLLAVQAAAVAGLIGRPETMQPARDAALAAAARRGDGIILLPHGNDGVGIVGAFAREAPPALPLLVVRPDETPTAIRRRLDGYDRVVLAGIEQDDASRAAVPRMRQAFAHPCWRPDGANAHIRVCTE